MVSRPLVIGGMIFSLLGGVGGTAYHMGRASVHREMNPIIQEYDGVADAMNEAQRDLDIIPLSERSSYVPQHKRHDYSVAQAHSRVERAHQRLGLAKANVEAIVEREPAVQEFLRDQRRASLWFVGGVMGLLLSALGFRRRG